MPLTGISRRNGELGAFTFRELVAQRKLAERAVRRRADTAAAAAMVERIDAELDARRDAKFDRAAVSTPQVD